MHRRLNLTALWAALQPLRAVRVLALGIALPLALAAPAQAAVVISQVYGGGGNSGATYKQDFIELFNNGTSPVDIGNWSVQYASAAGTSWAFTVIPAGTTLSAGGYLLIRQAAGTGGTIDVPGEITGTLALSGTGGKVALSSANTALSGAPPAGAAVVDVVAYGTATVGGEGTPTPALTNTTAALRNASGCTDTDNNSADFSVGAPAPRNTAATLAPCAGTGGGGGGETPPTPLAAFVYTIQGSGASSPLAGQVVATSGVVTKVLNNGFFIQDISGDGNPATSDGIFVFVPAVPAAAAPGNLVKVTGTVLEFDPGSSSATTTLTEIGSVTAVEFIAAGYTIAPTDVALPLAAGDSFERFEGMLVRLVGPMTVQQNFFQARFGQLTIGAGGRHETPTNRYRPGTAQALTLADLQARSRLLLDDGSSLQNVNPLPYGLANGLPRAGDAVSNLVGVLDYGLATATASGAGLYRLQPTVTPAFTVANPRTAAPGPVGGSNVTLGSMNVLNFFTTFVDGNTADGLSGQGCRLGNTVAASNCRGANGAAEFARQRAKIVRALAGLNADAVGLMEVQNNGNVAAQNLVDALNAFVGAGTYAAVPAPAAGTGTDAIRVAMIYKPARLNLVGTSASDTAAVNNRPTLAQTFAAANGERFTLVVNHLKSKGSCPVIGDADAPGNLDIGDGQGCWNALRVQQAQRLRAFVAQVQSTSGTSDVLLVGDFNAYGQEDPINDLIVNGYVDQSGRFEAFAYSYVFDGAAGRLDHAITTASLSAKVTGTVHWHIDADEGLQHDYNLEFKQPACLACAPDPYDGTLPFRASDHDPVLVGLSLFKSQTGSAGRDTLIGTAGDDVIVGGAGADTLTGGGGVNVFAYTSMRDAGDTITDFVPGKDYLHLRTLLRGLGYTGADPVADGWVRFVAIGSGTSVQIDADGPTGASVFRALATLARVAPGSVTLRDLIVR